MKAINKIFIGFVFGLMLLTLICVAIGIDSEAYNEETASTAEELPKEPVITEATPNVIELTNELTELAELDTELTELVVPEPTFAPLDIPLDADVQEYLKNKCDDANIDFAFVLALIRVESNFNPDAHSNTNDYGLMQINKCNHKSLSLATGATDFLDPYQNIDAGIYMLANLFERYEEAELVLMAYHFGEGKAKQLWNEGKYSSKYSQTILEYQLEYQAMLED